MSKKYSVDEEFIVQAHAAACEDWKIKLEAKFPEVFYVPSIRQVVQFAGNSCYGHSVRFLEMNKANDAYVFVQLPNANSEWTFAAFDYVKEFCKKAPDFPNLKTTISAYPIHGPLAEAVRSRFESEFGTKERFDNQLVISVHFSSF